MFRDVPNWSVDLKSKFYPVNSYAKFRVESHKCMILNKKKYNTNMTMQFYLIMILHLEKKSF